MIDFMIVEKPGIDVAIGISTMRTMSVDVIKSCSKSFIHLNVGGSICQRYE